MLLLPHNYNSIPGMVRRSLMRGNEAYVWEFFLNPFRGRKILSEIYSKRDKKVCPVFAPSRWYGEFSYEIFVIYKTCCRFARTNSLLFGFPHRDNVEI